MTEQFCTFRLGNHLCGITVAHVREVLLQCELTPVPLAPPALRGLMNLRGEVVAAIDLRMLMGLDVDDDRDPAHVIIDIDDVPTSLMVDAVEDVISVASESFEHPPQTVSGVARHYMTGVHKLEGRLLLVLDAQRIVRV